MMALSTITFVLAFSYPFLMVPAKVLLGLIFIITIIEYFFLNNVSRSLTANRIVAEKLSLGDEQLVEYEITNNSKLDINCALFDETPFQFQHRTSILFKEIKSNTSIKHDFEIKPIKRGAYNFGQLHSYISFNLPGLINKKVSFDIPFNSAVYPSVIQMRKFQLQVFSKTASLTGIRQIRKIGENDEFEYIKPYMQGDNIRSINWKATSRKSELMVNQFQDSRSQTVYCILDKGRSMKMPFNDMTLLDHAINTCLVISNIILQKYDKVGLISFSDKMGTVLRASSISGQLEKISKHLYKQKTGFKESNFKLLYHTCQNQITRRSIILFFSNFEHEIDLDRHLPYLRSLGKKHLLVVILFINTEIEKASKQKCLSKSDIYFKTFAERAIIEKEKIAYKLRMNGIQTILTRPEDLSINVINKYLEIKNRRLR